MMNSPNLGMSNNVPSPIIEAEKQQNNEEGKQWNKPSNDKRENSVPLTTISPKMDSLTAAMSPTPKSFTHPNGMSLRKKMRLEDEEYESLEMACNLASEMNDDCDAFGKHVAAQLRQMTKMQKFMSQRLISEICFRGQIQNLTLSSNIVNNPQHHQQQQQQTPQQPHHLQATIFAARPPHMPAAMYGRTPDYLLLHQQAVRPSNIVPTAQQHPYQNFMQPQSDHTSSNLE